MTEEDYGHNMAMPPMEYTKMPSVKMADKDTLVSLIALAEKYDFNRQGQWFDFDPQGVSILRVFLAFHDRSGNPNVPENDPAHHRCQVMVKVTGKDEPADMWLDVPAEVWDKLPDPPTVRDVPVGHM